MSLCGDEVSRHRYRRYAHIAQECAAAGGVVCAIAFICMPLAVCNESFFLWLYFS